MLHRLLLSGQGFAVGIDYVAQAVNNLHLDTLMDHPTELPELWHSLKHPKVGITIISGLAASFGAWALEPLLGKARIIVLMVVIAFFSLLVLVQTVGELFRRARALKDLSVCLGSGQDLYERTRQIGVNEENEPEFREWVSHTVTVLSRYLGTSYVARFKFAGYRHAPFSHGRLEEQLAFINWLIVELLE